MTTESIISDVLLGKIDLCPHLTFDREVFCRDLRAIRDNVPLLELSATTDHTANRRSGTSGV